MNYIIVLLAGFGGGVLRGLVGFIKHQFAYKEVKFKTGYFVFMMVLSGSVGLAAAWAIDGLGINFLGLEFLTPALAFVIGYAGGDFLENIYKIIIKEPIIYPTDNKE